MAAFVRFFSRIFRRKTEPEHSHLEDVRIKSKTKKSKKSDLECHLTYLDATEQTFYMPKNAKASELFDVAFGYVGIIDEKDYFSLKYMGKDETWLDPTKGIRHQCGPKHPYPIALKVKFFASDPHNLRDEYTRYLVVLQLREDIRTGRLPCTDLRLAAELAALLLQGEFGDFDRRQHTLAFVSTFRFLPDDLQTEQFELSVLQEYQALRNRNMTAADTELVYLQKASHIPDYGVDKHIVKGKDNQDYTLGLTPAGILVYEGSKKIGLFFWSMISNIEMKRKNLEILVAHEDETSRNVTEHFFRFVLPDTNSCKSLWKSAVEYHTFFRLTSRLEPPPKRHRFFRLRSRFQASFNTEYQLHYSNLFGSSSLRRKKNKSASAPSSPVTAKPPTTGSPIANVPPTSLSKPSSFRRVPSKRFSTRPSFSSAKPLSERRGKRQGVSTTKERTPAEIFNHARDVVTIERACLHDPAWDPSNPTSSTSTGTATTRSRPAPLSLNPSTSPPLPAAHVTPVPGRPPKPLLLPRAKNRTAKITETDKYFEVSV